MISILKHSKLKYLTFASLSAFLALNASSDWLILRLWNIRGGVEFLDLNAVLVNVDCFENIGWEIYETQQEDPCRNYVYGSTLIRILYLFGLGTSQKLILGWFAAILVAYILSDLTSKISRVSRSTYLIVLLVIISPPVLLLVERANFDWAIFALIYLSAILFARRYEKIGFVVLAFSALLKFYTFPLLCICLILLKTRKERIIGFLISTLTFILIVKDLTLLRTIYVDVWFAAFGNTVWAKYLVVIGVNLNSIATNILGICVTVILVIFLKSLIPKSSLDEIEIKLSSTNEFFAFFSSIVFLSCFFAGMNFDYRLVFLIPALSFVSEIRSSVLTRSYLILFLIAFLFSFSVKILQPIGDLAVNLLVAFMLLFVLSNRKVLIKSGQRALRAS